MKKLSLILVLMAFSFGLKAQTEVTFNFNNYGENQQLNGQDGWYVRVHSAGNGGMGPMYTDYMGHYSQVYSHDPEMPTLDETLGVFSHASGTSFGDIATHDLTQYGFDFSSGGIIEIECDILRLWWGDLFGIGYDGNGDGSVLPPVRRATSSNALYEPIYPDENSTSPDGGIYLMMTGVNPSNSNFMNGVVLPNNVITSNIQPIGEEWHWYRWKISIDLDANNGAGAVTLYMIYNDPNGEWEAVPECQGVNAGLTPGSGDKFDPATWHHIFMLNSGYGGFDNFTVRHFPGGLASQFIDFDEISDQLVYNAPITLQATATSGLPVSFEVVDGPATIEGNVLTLTGEDGQVKVRATQVGDGTNWQPAPAVNRVFYAVNPELYAPEITIRRPYEGTKVYMPDFENPVMIVLSAYIEHGNILKFEEVKCNVDGQELTLKTDYPDNPDNGYWYTTWTPSGAGTYNMTASIAQTGGKITTASNTFEVTTNYNDITVSALNGELVVNTSMFTNHGESVFPTHVNAFNAINMHYEHECVNNDCDEYDRVSHCRVKNHRGDWVELYRYTTNFGRECVDDLDVTDFTSLLQGLVEFELYMESYDGSGIAPTLVFEYTKGTPDYPYVDMQELWFGTFAFGDYDDLCPIPTRTVKFDYGVEKANLRLVASGHNWSNAQTGGTSYNTGNAAEFYEAVHNIKVNGTTRYTQDLWRSCNPQPNGCEDGGTWFYPRSGWCPGSLVLVWNYSLDDYIPNGYANLLYEFDPTYVDQCHPNYPDCVNGQNSCPYCEDSSNPIIRVSGKLVTFSHQVGTLTNAPELPDVDEEPFKVTLTPNPVNDRLTITTDYEKGRTGVHIINAQGIDVRRFSMQGTATIDVSDLPAGVYTVQILGGKMVTRKFVKN